MSADGQPPAHGRGFWAALVGGGAVMAFAVRGAWDDLSVSSFTSWGKWLIGADLVNDFVVLPIVALVCVALSRLPLGRWRAPVQAGLFASAMVLLVAGPGLAGTAEVSDNATIQPIDYRTSTLTALAVVWTIVVAWGLLAARRRRLADGAAEGVGD